MANQFGGIPAQASTNQFGGIPVVQPEEQEIAVAPIEQPVQAPANTISGRGIAGQQATDRRSAAIEEIRAINPAQADLIEGLSGPEAFLIGAGKGLTDLARGVGAVDPATESEQASFEQLQSVSPSAQVGEVVGQAAPFVAPGLGIANVASLPARAALSAGLGGAEGGIIASGQGGDAQDVAISTVLGASIGGGSEALLPVFNSIGRSLIKKFGGKGSAIGVDGLATPQLKEALQKSGSSIDDLVAATKEVSSGGDIAGNAQREAVFNRLGITPTEAQRTRDIDLFVDQQDAFRQTGRVRDALDLQETQLTERTAKVASDIGSTGGPSSAIDVVTDRSIRLDDEIGNLYSEARTRTSNAANIRPSGAVESLRLNSPLNSRSEGTVKALRDQMSIMGIAEPKGFKVSGRVSVDQAEELRQFSNSLFEGANAQGRKVIRDFKSSLDDDVFKVAGEDVFKSARKAKVNFERGLTKEAKNKFDRNRTSLVRDMLENTLAPDDAGKIVRAGSKYKAADLIDLKRYLSDGTPEDIAKGNAAWNDIRGSAMDLIRESSFTGPARADGSKSLSRAGLEKSFKAIGNDKLRILFNKQERAFLRDLADIAALKEPPPGTFTGTGPTGLAVKRLTDRLIRNSGVPGGDIASDIVGGFSGRRATRSQEKRVLKLVNDADRIQKQNSKKAFEALRKSQLGTAARAIPFATIPAIQQEE